MPAARRAPKEDSRQRIHQAAVRLFARYGYDAVSLQMIADEVGLHKSTLFHHYASKRELAGEVLDGMLEPVLALVARIRAQDPPQLAGFYDALDELVDHFAERADAARLLLSALTVPEDSELRGAGSEAQVLEFYAGLADWLDRARRAGVIRRVSIRQTIPNLIGLVLYYPAVAGDLKALVGSDPFSPRAQKVRKAEIRAMLNGLLAP